MPIKIEAEKRVCQLVFCKMNTKSELPYKGKYKGQKQKWYIMKFTGKDNEINLNTKKPEFLDWKWIEIDKMTDTVVNFKLEVYRKLQKEIKPLLNLERY